MNIRLGFICFLIVCYVSVCAENSYCFRVYLKDKGISCEETPERFLSDIALEKRESRNIPVGIQDRPIASSYIDSLAAVGGTYITSSRWLSTVVMTTQDSLFSEKAQSLPMVDSVKLVWRGYTDTMAVAERASDTRFDSQETPLKNFYGYAESQIKMLNGIKLHQENYQGEGISVAVIDAGFMNVDRISVFDSLKLAGTYNAVFPEQSVFEGDDHGTKVLSCMAAYSPGIMVGTAPKASYWLIKSEDSRSEYPIEEDYWAAAVEFADSVGVDVISSSLGYYNFDEEEMNYTTSALDGKTAFISQIAQIAADKGMLVFISAGNEGNGRWGKITFPSDAEHVLTVGAITEDKKKSSFSSVGFTADYRVKPDVVALGSGATVIDATGNIRYANGTSFSTPILAGLGVCLWQALPGLDNQQVISLIQNSSSQYKQPDAELGYGIPDMYKAYKEGRKNGKGKK